MELGFRVCAALSWSSITNLNVVLAYRNIMLEISKKTYSFPQEDVTCKCIRSTDYINQLSIDQLQTIVDNISFWSRMEIHDIHASDMLQLILTALDRSGD